MKKILIILVFLAGSMCFAANNTLISHEQTCQQRIDETGFRILNANKINIHIIFTYNKSDLKKHFNDPPVTKRQIIFYEEYFKYVSNDDELAAFLAHQISHAVKSYSGAWGGLVNSVQIKCSPKKYEIFADKRAVDYLVNAGYNPLGLITFMNKSKPQNILDKLLFHNPTSRRMAAIYEYIYVNYPYYLVNNEYIDNPDYQNFLLNSVNNRALLQAKIQSGSKKRVKYE